jgi:WD40 repeat protein
MFYLTRLADDDFYNNLNNGRDCYILSPPQTGKTRLCEKTQERFSRTSIPRATRYLGISLRQLDPTRVTEREVRPWLMNLVQHIARGLNINGQEIYIQFVKECSRFASGERVMPHTEILLRFIDDVLLRTIDSRIILVLDDIDCILSLSFAQRLATSLFSQIRDFRLKKCSPDSDSQHDRLTFALLGAASHELMEWIAEPLQDFIQIDPAHLQLESNLRDTPEWQQETDHLFDRLSCSRRQFDAILEETLETTNGHPCLTQRLMQLLIQRIPISPVQPLDPIAFINHVIESEVSPNWRVRSDWKHLQQIEQKLHPEQALEDTQPLLTLYTRILSENGIRWESQNRDQSKLRMIGIATVEEGKLKVHNSIYRRIFNEEWIESLLRPQPEFVPDISEESSQSPEEPDPIPSEESNLAETPAASEPETDNQSDRPLPLGISVILDWLVVFGVITSERKDLIERSLKTLRNHVPPLTQRVRGVLSRIQIPRFRLSSAQKIGALIVLFITAAIFGLAIHFGWQAYVLDQEAIQLLKQPKSLEILDKAIKKDKQLEALEAQIRPMSFLSLPIQNLLPISPKFALQQLRYGIYESNPLENPKSFKRFSDISFSPSGKKIAAVELEGNNILVWDKSGRLTTTIFTAQKGISGLSFRNDDQLATAGKDGTIKIWNVDSKELLYKRGISPRPAQDSVNGVRFSPDGNQVATFHSDGNATLWGIIQQPRFDLSNDQTLPHQQAEDRERREVNDLSFKPDSTCLITVGGDGQFNIWQRQGDRIVDEPANQGLLNTVAFNSDGTQFAIGSDDQQGGGKVRIWNIAKDCQLPKQTPITLPVSSPVRGLSFTQSHLIAVGNRGKVMVWKLQKQGDPELVFEPKSYGTADLTSVSADPTNPTRFITAGNDAKIRVWELDNDQGKKQSEQRLQGFPILSLAINLDAKRPEERSIAVLKSDGEVEFRSKRLDTQNSKKFKEKGITAINASPDGQFFITANRQGSIKLWDWETLESFKTLSIEGTDNANQVTALSINPTAKLIAVASADEYLRFWKIGDGWQEKATFSNEERVSSMSFSQDGKALVTRSITDTIRVWNIENLSQPKELCELAASPKISDVQFDPSSKDYRIATVSEESRDIRLWSKNCQANGEISTDFANELTDKKISGWNRISFSPNGNLFAVAGASKAGEKENEIYVWKTASPFPWLRNSPVASFQSHWETVNSLSFDAGSSSIIAGGKNGNLVISEFGK